MSKNWKLVVLSSLALVGSTVGIAAAEGGAPNEKFDHDRNGTLDITERAAMKAERQEIMFSKLDVNKDGVLSRQEFAAARQGRSGHHHHRRGGKGRPGERAFRGDKGNQ